MVSNHNATRVIEVIVFIGRNLFQPRKIIDEYHKNALTVQIWFASLAQFGDVSLESVMWAQLWKTEVSYMLP